MDLSQAIILGFLTCVEPINILFCFLGVLLGTLIGVLPGLGPAATIALILPITYHLNATASIIMLAGIYYGAKYGGSTTSILLNVPGEADSVATCLDGYQMALQGRAGPALGISCLGSFIAGTISVILIMLVAPILAKIALGFGPPEIFSLMCLGMTLLIFLASGSPIKAVIMASLGIFLGTVGMDIFTATQKFTFTIASFYDGIGIVPVIMGLFGIGEVLDNIEKGLKRDVYMTRVSNLLPNREDWRKSIGPILRGTFIGFFVGLLPGGGGVISTFASYTIEKRLSKEPEKFGKGAIEGVAGPEAANNSTSTAGFIPLMVLGIPTTSVMAVIFAALLISGLQPGPLLIRDNPSVFWGVIASMYIGNILLLILNLPLIGLWVRILKIPYCILFPLILFFCVVGAYSVNNNIVDVITMIIFGIIGYLMKKFEYEPAPLVMAFVLSSTFESSFLRALLMSGGSFMIFFSRPISGILLAAALLMLFTSLLRKKAIIQGGADD